MALIQKVYGVKTPISARIFTVQGVSDHHSKSRKTVAAQSEIGNLGRLQLKLQFISDKRNKFGIRGFSLGITDCIPEKSLQRIQIPTIPGNLNGVSDSTFHSGRGCLECFCHLGVQYLGDGVRVPGGPRRGFRRKIIYCIIHEPRHLLSIGLLK